MQRPYSSVIPLGVLTLISVSKGMFGQHSDLTQANGIRETATCTGSNFRNLLV
jgi:hypothetical protein